MFSSAFVPWKNRATPVSRHAEQPCPWHTAHGWDTTKGLVNRVAPPRRLLLRPQVSPESTHLCHRQRGCAGREDQTRYWSCALACCSAARRCAFSKAFAPFSSGVVPRLSGMVGDYARRPLGADRTHSSWSGEQLPLLTPPCRGLPLLLARQDARVSETFRVEQDRQRSDVPCRQARLPLLCRLFVPPTHVDARRTRNLRGAAALRSPQRKGAHWLVRPGDKQRQHASERHTLPQVGDRSLVRP